MASRKKTRTELEQSQGMRSQGSSRDQQYPRPREMGGKLIRRVIGLLRGAQLELPIDSHILIAVSAGPDSIALAHLLAKYGRRAGGKFTLVHVNHRWRGKESDDDARFVRDFARKMGVKCIIRQLDEPGVAPGESWEDVGRQQRKRVFAREAKRLGAILFTAHQADDLSETVLWRIFTGGAETHGGGIAVRHGIEIRPLLTTRKRELKAYLKEEGQDWREDYTNYEDRFMRAKMRMHLLPVIEQLFPRAVEHLVRLGLHAQQAQQARSPEAVENPAGGELLIGARGLKVRRPQWEIIQGKLAKGLGEVHLPEGWKLRREKPARQKHSQTKSSKNGQSRRSERWVLERD